MHVVILAAGFGMRLGGSVNGVAKALLPIKNGVTVLDHLITSLWVDGIDKIHIVHNGLFGAKFRIWNKSKRWIPRGERIDPPYIKLHNNRVMGNKDKFGSVGDLLFAIMEMRVPKRMLVVCGDNLFPKINIDDYDSDRTAITVHDVDSLSVSDGLGRVKLNDEGMVESIGSQGEWAFSGPAVLSNEDVNRVEEYCDLCVKSGVLPDSLGNFFSWLPSVYSIKLQSYFFDVGTADGYKKSVIGMSNER